MAYDATKPATGGSLLSADIRENFRALKEDGIVAIADSLVTKAKLKTNDTGSASGSLAASNDVSIEMQDYCFSPNIYAATEKDVYVCAHETNTADTTARIGLSNSSGNTSSYAVRWRYITASDKPFIYAIQDKITGKIKHLWTCDDPPTKYWGLSEKPTNFIAPVIEKGMVMATMNEIVLFNQNKEFVLELNTKAVVDKKLPFEILSDGYDFDTDKKSFSSKNLKEI